MVVVYKTNLNDETFIEKLGKMSIKALTRIAKERRSGSMGFAEAMVIEYNGKKKNSSHRLNIRLLYDKDVALWVENEPDDDEFEGSGEMDKPIEPYGE